MRGILIGPEALKMEGEVASSGRKAGVACDENYHGATDVVASFSIET